MADNTTTDDSKKVDDSTATTASKQKVDDVMTQMKSVKADDPDMVAKLNEIALKVAEAQGKKPTTASQTNLNGIDGDPMDELGCEGCQ